MTAGHYEPTAGGELRSSVARLAESSDGRVELRADEIDRAHGYREGAPRPGQTLRIRLSVKRPLHAQLVVGTVLFPFAALVGGFLGPVLLLGLLVVIGRAAMGLREERRIVVHDDELRVEGGRCPTFRLSDPAFVATWSETAGALVLRGSDGTVLLEDPEPRILALAARELIDAHRTGRT